MFLFTIGEGYSRDDDITSNVFNGKKRILDSSFVYILLRYFQLEAVFL